MTEGYEQFRSRALAELAKGDARAAFSAIRPALEYPASFEDELHFRDAFSIFARIAAFLAEPEFVELVNAVVKGADDPQALYDLGYQLIELGTPRIAAVVLNRANELAPGMEVILTELVCAFEESGLFADAVRVLHEVPEILEESFICRYLLAFNKLMLCNVEAARKILPSLQADADLDHKFMCDQLQGFLLRADVVSGVSPLDEGDLRGWHFVMNGALLLHLSPWGFDEGMHGRYAYTQDSASRCLEAIKRLKHVFEAMETKPPRVLMLKDRGSEILARAAAAALGLPLVEWQLGLDLPGLIPVYDLRELEPETIEALSVHRKQQILWCHASCWTEQQPFAADIVSYLYQYNCSPWSSRPTADAACQKIVKCAAQEGSAEDLSREITGVSLEEDTLDDVDELKSLVVRSRLLTGQAAAGVFIEEGRRRRQFLQSPVRSGRFV